MPDELTTKQQKINSFPERLRYLRERQHPIKSRNTTADLIGISREILRKYERGEATPTISKAALIAEYYGVTLDFLYYG